MKEHMAHYRGSHCVKAQVLITRVAYNVKKLPTQWIKGNTEEKSSLCLATSVHKRKDVVDDLSITPFFP